MQQSDTTTRGATLRQLYTPAACSPLQICLVAHLQQLTDAPLLGLVAYLQQLTVANKQPNGQMLL